MYKISVPISNRFAERMGKDKLVKELRKLDAQRVFLSIGTYIMDENQRKAEIDALRDNCSYFKANGFEVGAWYWTFWVQEKNSFTKMVGATGQVSNDFICPSDEAFRDFAKGWIKEIASCGVDLIMFDDDYRYGFLDMGMGCICENHMEYMEKILGEKIDENTLPQCLLSGGKNKYRDAWLEANGYYMRLFAREMREALDEINPNIRLGLCSCMSLWDTDGVDTFTISKILAGKTKPFVRLIGAPYWAVNKGWGNRLQNIIELERMEKSWCEDEDIEIFAEGDVNPRPRINCPANYLELFDMAIRADGRLDGILKYGIDYTSNPDYETGYAERHLRNKPVYDEIHRSFDDKKVCGVRVYEKMNKFSEMVIPDEVAGTCNVQDIFFSPAARMMSDCSIPTIYNGDGVCGIAFAENINMVPEEAMKNGIIIDARAASILQAKGIDTGIISVGNKIKTNIEYFADMDEYVNCTCEAYDMKISDKARILSRFLYFAENGITQSEIVASYLYENNKGYKFLVFTFDGYFNGEAIYRSYARSYQIKNTIEQFFNRKLPAYSYGNPDFYIIAKKNGPEMAVAMFNCFADSVLEPVIELDKKYSDIKFINCNGKMMDNKVYLDEIAPFAFAGIVVK